MALGIMSRLICLQGISSTSEEGCLVSSSWSPHTMPLRYPEFLQLSVLRTVMIGSPTRHCNVEASNFSCTYTFCATRMLNEQYGKVEQYSQDPRDLGTMELEVYTPYRVKPTLRVFHGPFVKNGLQLVWVFLGEDPYSIWCIGHGQ